MKILAAMSGGVDSAVAAARAVAAGHEVVGVHLALNRMPGTLRTGSRGCCTVEDAMDARRVSDILGIPFYVWDFSDRFSEDVVDDFISEYQAGRTPNPCMRCNEKIKFEALLNRAVALGFDAVCTGHYAVIKQRADKKVELHRASAWAKDQSYVLAVLDQDQLKHCYFPLGDTPSKDLVRQEAQDLGLIVAKKPDSHDICFIPDGDTRAWIQDKIGKNQGDIVDAEGNKLGEHDGAVGFTVGQRRGLKIGTPAPDGKPRFVLSIRPKENQVVVGSIEDLDINTIMGGRISWTVDEPIREQWHDCEVQIRAHADPVRAKFKYSYASNELKDLRNEAENELVVVTENYLKGVAAGQTAAVYVGTQVLGQFTIDLAK